VGFSQLLVIANGSSSARAAIQLLVLAIIYALVQPANSLILPVCILVGALVCTVAVPLSHSLWAQHDKLVQAYKEMDVHSVPFSLGGSSQTLQQSHRIQDALMQHQMSMAPTGSHAPSSQNPRRQSVLLPYPEHVSDAHSYRRHDALGMMTRSEILRADSSTRKVNGDCRLSLYATWSSLQKSRSH